MGRFKGGSGIVNISMIIVILAFILIIVLQDRKISNLECGIQDQEIVMNVFEQRLDDYDSKTMEIFHNYREMQKTQIILMELYGKQEVK